ncbi:uncharacterized protein BDR25DRAFT_320648 [Lindgomyces ingoldianus]|uniref:Uncharacterized protein n=1 Tax=Lindgomyces ingoldianus TaxID=673940 RepID=A0ACB6Q6X5_9PLEO|nr:uncharacterized protein BDR25DRAFT_320648 [Lindgomyces ingoldianus]KAF2462555.1 hypothetical protein BDR25DRAFT_320648 [Lindgomyces ingoldianus]
MGKDRVVYIECISDTGDIGFLVKGDPHYESVNYTLSSSKNPAKATRFKRHYLRSLSWSPDSKNVVYGVSGFYERHVEDPIVGWDDERECPFITVMPSLSMQGKIANTEFSTGNSTVAVMKSEGTEKKIVFDSMKSGMYVDHGQWIAFSLRLQLNDARSL